MSDKEQVDQTSVKSAARGSDHVDKPSVKSQGQVEKDSKLAWLACGCAIVDQIFICGFLQIFGVFFVEFVSSFNSTRSHAAWLGSLTCGMMKLFGPVTGAFVVRFNNRVSMMIGCCICSLSMLISSFMTSMAVLYLTFSIMYGVGASLVITCAMVLANTYFDRYLGWATGLVCAGSSVGVLILAPFSQYIIEKYSWRIAFRIFSGIYLFVGGLNSLVRPMTNNRGKKYKADGSAISNMTLKEDKIEKKSLFKNRAFILWIIGTALGMFGYYIPFVHLVYYGVSVGISANKASYFIMTLGGATTIGRLVSGRIVQAGFINSLHLNQFCMIITGALYMILPAITSFVGLLPFVVFLGLIDGCYVVLLPVVTCSLVAYNEAILAWGLLACAGSLTFTLGPPSAGALFDIYGNYNLAFHVAGVPVICGALVLFFIPWARRTSPPVTSALQLMRSRDKVIDSATGSVKSVRDAASEETIHFNQHVKEASFILPTGHIACTSDVQQYLDRHYNPRLDHASVSASLGNQRRRTNPIEITSESLPLSLALICGPDGMPISVPSAALPVPRGSRSIITGVNLQSPPHLQPQYCDACTQFNEDTDTRGIEFNNKSQPSTSDWSVRNSATSTSDLNRASIVGKTPQATFSVNTAESVTVEPNSSRSVPMPDSVSTRDSENQDIFQHIFKQTSDSSL